MTHWGRFQSLVSFCFALSLSATLIAAEPLHILDLVAPDSALCIEVPRLEQTLSALNSSPLMARLSAFPLFQRFLESDGVRKWCRIEKQVFEKTGQSLAESFQLMCAKSLVLALRLPINEVPQGLMITEALNGQVVQEFIENWNQYETDTAMIAKSHRGVGYFQRQKRFAPNQTLYFVTSDLWFALSDHESCIRDVIDRLVGKASPPIQRQAAESSYQTNPFLKCRERLNVQNGLFVHINERPWDSAIDESVKDLGLPIHFATIWNQIGSVSSCLRIEQDLVCDSMIELDKSRLSSEWPKIVATSADESVLSQFIPPNAFLVVQGKLELAPLIRFIEAQLPPTELAKMRRFRRSVQSLLGGYDLFDAVLPPLAKKFCGFLTADAGPQNSNSMIDGILECHFAPTQDPQIVSDVGRCSDTCLNVRAASVSADHPRVVTVHREVSDTIQLEWLSEPVAFPSAFGIKNRRIVIAGSEDSLRRTFELPTDQKTSGHRSQDLGQRFRGTQQFVWLDTIQVCRLLKLHGPEIVNFLSSEMSLDSGRVANSIDDLAAKLELIDSLFIGCHVDADRIRLTLCGDWKD